MASAKPEYFISPTWDFPPNGPIALGSVLTSLKKPHRRLARCPPAEADVLMSSKSLVEVSKSKLKSGGFSVLTTFLSGLLGLSADAGTDWAKCDTESFTFDFVNTTHFIPTEEYVKRSIDNASVRRFLETTHYRRPVYIITGVKVVSGAQGAKASSRALEAALLTQVDGTVLSGGMVPIGGGPGFRRSKETKTTVSWEGSTDFVFAFKVNEVCVSKSLEVKRERDYTKGALFEDRADEDEINPLAVAVLHELTPRFEGNFIGEPVEEGDDLVTYGVLIIE